MGILNKFGLSNGKGIDCTQNADGTETCNVIEKRGDEIVATGSQFTMNSNGCDMSIVGDYRATDEDRDVIARHIEERRKSCRVKPGAS